MIDNYVHDVWMRLTTPENFLAATKADAVWFIQKIRTDPDLEIDLKGCMFEALMHCKSLETEKLLFSFGYTSMNLHMMLAARFGRTESVIYWLSKGVSPSITLTSLFERDREHFDVSEAELEDLLGKQDMLFEDHRMQEAFGTYPNHAVTIAAEHGHLETVKILEAVGAKMTVTCSEDPVCSIVEAAWKSGNMELVRYLYVQNYIPEEYYMEKIPDYLLRLIHSPHWGEPSEIDEECKEDRLMFLELKKKLDPETFRDKVMNFKNKALYDLC
jgi:hypothetical protein